MPRSMTARSMIGILLLTFCFFNVFAESPSCSAFQYDDNGVCRNCRPFSTTEPGANNGSASCVCLDNYYKALSGECERCPPATTSVRGENNDVSGCKCKRGWAGSGGVCVYCGSGGYAMPPFNTDPSDCECRNHWYGAGGYETCTRCPYEEGVFSSRAERGSNDDISSCLCPNNWYGENGICQQCPADSYSRQPNNKDISSCLCRDNWFGREGNCSRCRDHFPSTWSLTGENFEPEDCECGRSFYGTGGANCARCPKVQVAGVGAMWLGSDTTTNSDPSWEVACDQCGSSWFGKPEVSDPQTFYGSASLVEISGCSRCPSEVPRSFVGENRNESNCLCKTTDYLFNNTQNVLECRDCPNSTRSVEWNLDAPWPAAASAVGGVTSTGVDSCQCAFSQSWYGPILYGEENRECFRCPTNSWRDDIDQLFSTAADCKCRPGYYGPPGDECIKCPSEPGLYSSTSEYGTETVEECLCPNGWYGPENGACERCPDYAYSIRPDNKALSQCVCRNNYFRTETGECEVCPNSGKSTAGSNDGVQSCSCPAGYFGLNSTSCELCPRWPANGGRGTSVVGQSHHESDCSCPSHYYGESWAEGCTQCPDGRIADRGVGMNVLPEACSCLDDEYGQGMGFCEECPEGSKSKKGRNYAVTSCSCPANFYGPGYGSCTACPDGATSLAGFNYGVYACTCPAGTALSYNYFVNTVKQPPQCLPSAHCDGVIDKVSNKCWKLFDRETRRNWDQAQEVCLEWAGPAVPDAFLNNPDYFPTPGHLPSIVTNEDLLLSTIFFEDYGYVMNDELWVGATDEGSEGNWTWSDGSSFVFQEQLWGKNQPNNGGANMNEHCATVRKTWFQMPVNQRKPLLDDYRCERTDVWGVLCTKSPNKCISGNNQCSDNAECVDRDFGTGYFGYACACHFGFLDVNGDGSDCQPATVGTCNETLSDQCHEIAYCHVLDLQPGVQICSCPEGFTGDGYGPQGCQRNAWTVRTVMDIDVVIPNVEVTSRKKLVAWPECKESIARLFFGVNASKPVWFTDAMHHVVEAVPTQAGGLRYQMTLNALFESEAQAQVGMQNLEFWAGEGVYACTGHVESASVSAGSESERRSLIGADQRSILAVSPDTILPGTPGVYTWTAATTDAPVQIAPTGMEIEAVFFKPDCLATGCWVVDVIYTRGEDNVVSFYLPHALRIDGDAATVLAPGAADLAYDPDYSVVPAESAGVAGLGEMHWYWEWNKAPETTFAPANFPCRSHDYAPTPGDAPNPVELTVCCIREFRQTYRPVLSFFDDTAVLDTGVCRTQQIGDVTASGGERPWDTMDPTPSGETSFPVYPTAGQVGSTYRDAAGNAVQYAERPRDGLQGLFAGMALSNVQPAGVLDPFIGQYKARFELDEKELREMAGKVRGTVGVEHTVDTFLGFAEFKPTGTKVLDPFATQANIHLEKTSFFSVSTHGVNDYTFLEYINLRLVAVYDEDTDPTETVAENGDRTSRTNSTGAAHYVQITFTLGAQYEAIETGLIPLDSVRVGQGTFMASAFEDKARTVPGMTHACVAYTDADASTMPSKAVFDERIPFPPSATSQQCAPAAGMCLNPASIPDNFVVFNIPLGVDWLPEPASDLSENVFVDLVVSAVDTVAAGTPNNGDAPHQMKTTLTASIPVVQGGVNIFCDQITAKTDLVDVVNADLIIGSAADMDELSRLTIFKDIASTDMSPTDPSLIDTDSIEASLMTLVLKGNVSYFSLPTASAYGVQLEDLITLHVMEPGETRMDAVKALLAAPGADNNVANGLDTDGYTLNGAFRFRVDRANFRAILDPTEALLALCPFNPPRPTAAEPFPTTCVLRRDVQRRSFPARVGAVSTATEVEPEGAAHRHRSGVFLTTILGDNDYAYALGGNFTDTVAAAYGLNGQWRRAFMINPGYEWTPTQTGGQSIFTVSQKIVMFALIGLDETFNPTAPAPSQTLPTTRPAPTRRMLLQKNVANSDAGIAGQSLEFKTSYRQLIANSYGVPEDRIATYQLVMELGLETACLEVGPRHVALTKLAAATVGPVASALEVVLVLSHSVDMRGSQCSRRTQIAQRRSGDALPASEMEVLVAFKAGQASIINMAGLAAQPGVLSVQQIDVSPKVSVDNSFVAHADDVYDPDAARNADEDSASSNMGLIAGIAGGVGGAVLVLVLGGAAWMYKSRAARALEAEPKTIGAVNSYGLKAELTNSCDLKAELTRQLHDDRA